MSESRNEALVSIIIPCFNREDLVGRAVESAIQQTHPHKEIIVVDDGSTDRSVERIEAFGDAVHLIRRANGGVSAARNAGLNAAKGEYIQFLDSDDFLLPEAVTVKLRAFSEHVDMVFGDLVRLDSTGRRKTTVTRLDWPPDDELAYLLRHNIHVDCALYRRQRILSIGGFDESMRRGEDWDLHLRMSLAGHRMIRLPVTVACVRDPGGRDGLSRKDWYDPDPLCRLRVLGNMQQRIETASGRPLSRQVREALADNYLINGRSLLRAGLTRHAEDYLALAAEVAPDGKLPVSKVYLLLRRLVGARWAELLCFWRSEGFGNLKSLTRNVLGSRRGENRGG